MLRLCLAETSPTLIMTYITCICRYIYNEVRISSTTTKIRIVFEASVKTSTEMSLTEQFMIGPTIHSLLINVQLHFRNFSIAIMTDVSRMYRAVLLPEERDLHVCRFVWRDDPKEPLKEYRMTQLTFRVLVSFFAANMAVKCNAVKMENKYPQTAKAVVESFYVDNELVGAESIQEA